MFLATTNSIDLAEISFYFIGLFLPNVLVLNYTIIIYLQIGLLLQTVSVSTVYIQSLFDKI